MKNRHSKTSVTFHPDWIAMLFFIAVTAWAWVCCFRPEICPAWLPNENCWIVGTISAVITIVATRSCRITREGLSIRYLGIPFRKIGWDRVTQVVIAPYDPDNFERKELVIVLDNGPAFTEEDTARRFNQANKHSSYLITLQGRKINETAKLINVLIPAHIAPIPVDTDE